MILKDNADEHRDDEKSSAKGGGNPTASLNYFAFRIFALAKELSAEFGCDIRSKQILEICRELGFENVTNQFHALTDKQAAAVRKHFAKANKKRSQKALMIGGITVRGKNRNLVAKAIELLKEQKPMTVRQLYYQLVSAGLLKPVHKEYKRLCKLLSRLRETGDVPRSWLVDNIRATLKPSSWTGLAEFGDVIRDSYRKSFWPSMDHYVEIFIEKDAIAGTIQPVTYEYDVRLYVVRGYSSISFAGEIADIWARVKKPIFGYYLGDYDASGFDIERDLREKLSRYSGRTVYVREWDEPIDWDDIDPDGAYWTRLAVNRHDFAEHDLVRLAVKSKDKRAKEFIEAHGSDCAEVDAIPPKVLRSRVKAAIEAHVDQERWERLKHVEELEQKFVLNLVNSWNSGKSDLGSLSADDAENGGAA